jgi:sensor histidine kinase YesM
MRIFLFFLTFLLAQSQIARLSEIDSICFIDYAYISNGEWKILSDLESVLKEEKVYGKYNHIENEGIKAKYSIHSYFEFDSTKLDKKSIIYRQWSIYSASKVFINGKEFFSNGRIGNSLEEEIAGNYTVFELVADTLIRNGINVISILVSNYNALQNLSYGNPSFMHFKKYVEYKSQADREMIMVATILLFSVLISFILYMSLGKNKSYLFFSASCFFLAFKLLIKIYLYLNNSDLIVSANSYNLVTYSYALGNSFLIIFLMSEVKLKKVYLYGGITTLISFIMAFFIQDYNLLTILTISFCLIYIGIKRKHQNSYYYLIGLIALSVCSYLGYEDKLHWGYFIGVIVFISSIFFASVREIIINNQLHNETKLRSSRLENQMLKKNIQPHFLMNSLVSLQQLAKEDHQKAIEMIDALADEFHLFSKASEKKLIPIDDELEICRAHLKIMEFRKDATFQLKTEGITGKETIPPAIFHTLIENGISHGYAFKDEGIFILKKIEHDNLIEYQLENDGDSETDTIKRKNGTGTKYIKARLTESYGDKWDISCKEKPNGYLSIIKIYK